MDTSGPIVLAGGSGFLGMNHARTLVEQGCTVVILARSEPDPGDWSWAQWDGRTLGEWARVLDGAQAVVNFSGRSIDCYPTPDNQRSIIDSRVDSTRILGDAIGRAANPPKSWIQLSAVGIYGHTPSPSTETAPVGSGFLPEVCDQWEQAHRESCPEHVRSVVLRSGVVLGRSNGAFPMLRRFAKLGLGGAAGAGTQGMSWIHEDDMTSILQRAIDDRTMQGTYNACAPNPKSNRAFMRALRKELRMPIGPPAPAFAVRLASRFILKTNPDLALEGQYAIPERIMDAGYEFAYPTLEEALRALCKRG